MCKETYHILQRLDFHKIETQFALQCAPLFSGLKISNLFIIRSEDCNYMKEILKETGILYYFLTESENKVTLLLYKEKDLIQTLSRKEITEFFQRIGYLNGELGYILSRFKKRYKQYMITGRDFPHEMGLLLGYPIEDVNGFIDNEGKNFLHSGYWKVYENLPEKLHLFQRYEKAKKNVMQLIFHGIEIRDIINSNGDTKLQQLAG